MCGSESSEQHISHILFRTEQIHTQTAYQYSDMSHVMVVGTNMDAFIVYIDQQKLNGGIKAANKKLIC